MLTDDHLIQNTRSAESATMEFSALLEFCRKTSFVLNDRFTYVFNCLVEDMFKTNCRYIERIFARNVGIELTIEVHKANLHRNRFRTCDYLFFSLR